MEIKNEDVSPPNVSEELIKSIAEKAVEVGVLTAEREEAFRQELAAEAELLERLADLLPQVTRRALSVRVPSRSVTKMAGAYLTEQADYLEGRYVLLDDKHGHFTPGRERALGDQNRGTYHGELPALRVDGRWCKLICAGAWSSWQGEADRIEVEEHDSDAAEIAKLLRPYGLDTALEWLSARLSRQLDGDSRKVTERAKARAERLRALVVLLG